MKKIIILVFIFVTCFVQAQEPEPDSLVGIYHGITYIKNSDESEWHEFEDTIVVIDIDTTTCLFSCIKGVQQFNDRILETSYSFCQRVSTNYYFLFYSEDSIKSISSAVPAPPPNTYTTDIYFYGKRIPNSSYVGLNEVEPDNVRLNLYPNPSCDILFFDFPGSDMINCNVTIRNVFGSIVYCDEVSGENCFIDVSGFADGIYFFEWSNVLGNGIDKFIVY